MKKCLCLTVAAFAVALIFISMKANAQQQWSRPIPVASDQTQAGSDKTDSDAAFIKFFEHPKSPEDGTRRNFTDAKIIVEPLNPASDSIRIEDLIAVPGFLRTTPAGLPDSPSRQGLLDDIVPLSSEALEGSGLSPLDPVHGFCPTKISWLNAGVQIDTYYECDALATVDFPDRSRKKNLTDRQIETADIRNTIPATDDSEFTALIGSPLERFFIGDAQESLLPYTTELFPATIKSPANFKWTYNVKVPTGETIDFFVWTQPYTQNFAYGIADFSEGSEGGMVTALYDPVYVEKFIRTVIRRDGAYASKATINPIATPAMYEFLRKHISPLVYLRRDDKDGVKRLRLSGYSSWHMGKLDFKKLDSNFFSGLWKLFLSQNFSPISLEKVEKSIAVVNQGTFGSLKQYYMDGTGKPLDIDPATSGTQPIKWRDLLIAKDSITGAMGSLKEKYTSSPGEVYFPHDIVSYVVFWPKTLNWTQPLNPNDVFANEDAPLIFAPVGPGMFDSTVLVDKTAGGEKQYLVVASGEGIRDPLDPSGYAYYIYKISPDGEKLYFNSGKLGLSVPNVQIGVIGEPYRVRPPRSGYAPYQIEALNVGESCPAVAVTWRGADTVWEGASDAAMYFQNIDGDKVRFKNSSTPASQEMFSECFSVYYSMEKTVGGASKCVFPEDAAYKKDICIGAAAGDTPKWQIAALAVIPNYNGPGKDGLIIGNLNPMKIPANDPYGVAYEDAGKYTAYAGLFEDVSRAAVISRPDELIRMGYKSADIGPLATDMGQYLVNVWKETGNEIAGVGALTARMDFAPYFASGNFLPLSLPPFGCLKFDGTDITDTAVESPIEMLWSAYYNAKTPGISIAESSTGPSPVPLRCRSPIIGIPSYGPAEAVGGGTPAEEVCDSGDVPPGTFNCSCATLDTLPGACADAELRCCRGCDTNAERTTYSLFCDALIAACCPAGQTCCETGCCPVVMETPPVIDIPRVPPGGLVPSTSLHKDKKNWVVENNPRGDGGSSDSGSTDFAKCDKIYDSKTPYIASMGDLKHAQLSLSVSNQLEKQTPTLSPTVTDQTWQDVQKFLVNVFGLSEEEAVEVINEGKKNVGNNKRLFESLIIPFMEIFSNQITPPGATNGPALNKPDNLTWLTNLFIKDAYAFTLAPFVRFPRGHVMPGKFKEIAVVMNKHIIPPPLSGCGDGLVAGGEQCDIGNPTASPSIPPVACELPGDICNTDCSCSHPGETPSVCGNYVKDPGEECDRTPPPENACPEGLFCDITCHCTAITTCEPPCTACEAPDTPTVVIKCSGFTAPEIQGYFDTLNDRARKLAPGLKDSDLFCEIEGTMEALISVPGADKSVGAFIQTKGSFPVDFTQMTELPRTANMVTAPTKLLPFEGTITTTRGLTISSPDLSASATGLSQAVEPLSSDMATSVNFGEDIMTLNNVLSWQIATAPTKLAAVEAVVSKITGRIQPMLGGWSTGGETQATEEGFSFGTVDIEQVFAQLEANASKCHDGYCEADVLAGFWPEYQSYSYMLVQNVKKADLSTEPVKMIVTQFGAPSSFAQGGGVGCKCDMTALPPDIASAIALLMFTAIATTGFVVVRTRVKRK